MFLESLFNALARSLLVIAKAVIFQSQVLVFSHAFCIHVSDIYICVTCHSYCSAYQTILDYRTLTPKKSIQAFLDYLLYNSILCNDLKL